MSEPLTTPTAPPPPPAGARPGNPWDRRQELGFGRALIDNLKLFVTAPGQAFAQTLEKGDYGGPLLFAVIVGWICVAIGQIWQTIFGASLFTLLPSEMAEQLAPLMVTSGASIVFQLLLAPIYIVAGLFIGSAILHLCLMIVGGLGESQAGFEGTFRVLCFAGIANLAQIVPFIGGLVGLVWWVVLGVLGFSSLHRTTQGKALLAILIPLILCCLCLIVGMLMFGATMAAMFSQAD